MQLGSLLSTERILLPLRASRVEEALAALVRAALPEGVAPPRTGSEGEVSGGAGERVLHAPSPEVRVVVQGGVPGDFAAMGVALAPLGEGAGGTAGEVQAGTVHSGDLVSGASRRGEPEEEQASAAGSPGPRVVLLLGRSPGSRVSDEGIDRLLGALARPEVVRAILRATTPEELLGIRLLMNTPLAPPIRVGEAVTPTPYRVYPDTPLGEVLDLMARKGVTAIPVVGASLQVVGILTAGDGLRLLLETRGQVNVPAREVMTRAVLCVTEDQELEEAARLMVNRNLRQLPVVREGEIVGFLTREMVLRRLFQGRGGGEAAAP